MSFLFLGSVGGASSVVTVCPQTSCSELCGDLGDHGFGML